MIELKKTWFLWAVVILIGVLSVGSIVAAYYGKGIRNIILESGAVLNYQEAPFAIPAEESITSESITSGEELGGAGQNLPYRELKIGDILHTYRHVPMINATSTPCYIKSPAATSTLVYASVDFTTSSTTDDSFIDIAKSATDNATTTILGASYRFINSTHAGPIIASTTDGSKNVFPPNYYLVVKMGGGVGSSDLWQQTGICNAEWISTK